MWKCEFYSFMIGLFFNDCLFYRAVYIMHSPLGHNNDKRKKKSMKNWVLKLHHQSREKKMKHAWSSVVHPGSVREEDDRTVWSRRSRRLRGCKPRTFCHLAQQPWQEVSLQTWWSHSYRKHVAAAPPPPPPPPPSAQLTHISSVAPCRD